MEAGRVDVRRRGGVWVLRLLGEHDIDSHELVLEQMRRMVGTGIGVIVDISQAELVDSMVVAALVADHDQAPESPGDRVAIVVSGDGTRAERSVELAGIDEIIPTFTSLDDALDSMTGRSAVAGAPRPPMAF